MRSIKGARWAAVCAVSAAGLALAATPAAALSTDRWWGNDRHGTSASTSTANFTGHVEVAVVVNGTSFADALSAAPLAAARKAPLLTVTAGALPEATRAELTRLTPTTIIVVGGPAVVSDAVVEQLKGYASGGVTRQYGQNRYDTSRVISDAQFAGRTTEVFVASGDNFPDALAAGAAGAALGAPLVLTSKAALSVEAREAIAKLAPKKVTIVGGTSVVSPAVEAELVAAYPGAVTRIAGGDRYDTAAKVLLATRGSAGKVVLASGTNFPDALAGAATGKPMLLSRPDCLPQVTAEAYTRLGVTAVTGLGGSGVLSDAALGGSVCVAAPTPTATPSPSSTLAKPGKKNCSDFSTWRAAQDWFEMYYPAYGDVAGLDRDKNRIACESLPGAP